MTTTTLKGNTNRAVDYVNDVERWTGHAKAWLKGWGGNRPDSVSAMNSLSNAHAAILKAMEYIRTGEEQNTKEEK